jgi:dual specificity phosphatase 12
MAGISNFVIPMEDTEHENLLDVLPRALAFIDQARQAGNVLVHCIAGVSRSASIVIAYLMSHYRLALH